MMATRSQEELEELAATSTKDEADDESSLDESDINIVSHDEVAGRSSKAGPSLPINWVQNNESEEHRRVQQSVLGGALMEQQQQSDGAVAISPRPLPLHEVNKRIKEFTCTCKLLYEKIGKLKSTYGEVLIPKDLWQEVQQIKKLMDEKEIMVNVFGEHNCGKSTFLNALLGKYFLPVKKVSCTALTVKIQHSHEVHPVCDDGCKSRPTKKCPQLHEIRNTGKTVMTGCDAIYKHLKNLNDRFRLQDHDPESPETLEVPNLVLKVHLPILEEGSPLEWTVILVDNPGFGEDMEYITQLASASLGTSSAYIYLITTENIGGKAATDFFKTLQKKDPTALYDRRLIVGITKADTLHDDDDVPVNDSTSEEEVIAKLRKSIKSATGTEIYKDLIVPVSSKWSLSDTNLTDWLRNHSNCDKKPCEIVKAAVKALEKRHKLLPVGQDETVEGVITKMDPKALLEMLESASGIPNMKARIHDVIGKACIKTWAIKLYRNFVGYCNGIRHSIDRVCEELNQKRKSEEAAHDNAKELLDALAQLRGELEDEMKSESAAATFYRLEESYFKDVQRSKAPETGKLVTESLVTKFKTDCEKKFKSGEFLSSDFQHCVNEFLVESRPKLQAVFDECRFDNVDKCIAKLNEETIKRVGQLEEIARRLLGLDHPRARSSTSDSEGHHKLAGPQNFGSTASLNIQVDSAFPRSIISEDVKERILQSADFYSPNQAVQVEDPQTEFPVSLASVHAETDAETDAGISASDASQEEPEISDCNEHRELGPQGTCLRDLTSTGRVPEMSSSWWEALQDLAKDIWDQLKRKAKNFKFHTTDTKSVVRVDVEPSGSETSESEDSCESDCPTDVLPAVESAGNIPGSCITTTVTATDSIVTTSPVQATANIAIPNSNDPKVVTEGDVSASVESGVVIDNWSGEVLLESAIQRIQKTMEDECDKYFKEIAPDAVKFFHGKYQGKIETTLMKFDTDFKVALDNKTKEIKKVKERETALQKRIAKFREHKKKVFKLEEQLNGVWKSLGLLLEGQTTQLQTTQQSEETEKMKHLEHVHVLINEFTNF